MEQLIEPYNLIYRLRILDPCGMAETDKLRCRCARRVQKMIINQLDFPCRSGSGRRKTSKGRQSSRTFCYTVPGQYGLPNLLFTIFDTHRGSESNKLSPASYIKPVKGVYVFIFSFFPQVRGTCDDANQPHSAGSCSFSNDPFLSKIPPCHTIKTLIVTNLHLQRILQFLVVCQSMIIRIGFRRKPVGINFQRERRRKF